MSQNKEISAAEKDDLISVLKARFEKNMDRHQGIHWGDVQTRLQAADPDKLWSILQMENSGGEPDVVAFDNETAGHVFYDCSAESPKGRRSLCYDQQALESRKENKPNGSAVASAREMGVELLTEEQYAHLQTLGEFDLKTSSWVTTAADIRQLGGAIFCDRRFGRVFTYHNGAESYYAARGFRGSVIV
jgi:hypothetical protein